MKVGSARTFLILAIVGAAALGGCNREEQPKPKTVADIDAQIATVQQDPKMPPGIKQMVLGQLEGEKRKLQNPPADR